VVVGGEAYVSVRDAGAPRTSGIGDTTFTLKRAWLAGEGEAYGLELTARAPTAKAELGGGKADYEVNGIVSRDFGTLHMDANLNATRIGARGPGEGRVQTGLSARGGAPSTAQVLVAAAYSPNPRLTFDFGVAHGLNPATPQWAWFTGVVLPLVNF
jgi:hypothetical protein